MLTDFFVEAQSTLEEIAKKYGLKAPGGAFFIQGDVGVGMLASSFYVGDPDVAWADAWNAGYKAAGILLDVVPGAVLADQEGGLWELRGLDPMISAFPVRMRNKVSGEMAFMPVEAINLMYPVNSH